MGAKHQMKDQSSVKYMDALNMVSYPRDNIDANGNFVGYGPIEDQLIAYRDSYAITEEEYQYLRQRLFAERDRDPNKDD